MYFFSKGILGAAIITLVSSVKHPNTTKPLNNAPGLSIITSLIEQFISPKAGTGISIKTRSKPSTTREGTIEWVIQNKVAQLKNYLQDNDNLLEDKEEETIIIEFLPKKQNAGKENLNKAPKNDSHNQVLQNGKNELTNRANDTVDNVNPVPQDKAKYLKVREKIKSQLHKEAVSGETVDYVLKKVDYLIDRLIKSDCTLKSSDTNKMRSQDQSVHFSVKWTKRWDDLKKRYFNVIKDPGSSSKDKDSKLSKAMDEYGKFFSSIIEDVNLMSTVYSLQCKLLKKDSNLQRRTNDISKLCKNFKICSTELGIFLNDFYYTLNDTVIEALKNYAAMYSVDVAADENDSDDDVAKTIKQFVEKAKKTIRRIFETELGKFKLDKNKDSGTNMELIKSFVNTTLQSLKSNMRKNIERTLDRHSDVKEDLYLNLYSEIDEYSRIAQKKICKSFQTCNGNGRRSFGYKSMVEGSDVYVNVRVGINDDKNILFTNARRRFVNDDRYQSTVRSRFIPYKSRIDKHKRNARKRQMNVTIVEDNSPVPIKLNNFRSKINLKSLRRREDKIKRSKINLSKINKRIHYKSEEGLITVDEYNKANGTSVPTPTTLASNDLLTSKLAFKAHISIDKDNPLMELVKKITKPNDHDNEI